MLLYYMDFVGQFYRTHLVILVVIKKGMVAVFENIWFNVKHLNLAVKVLMLVSVVDCRTRNQVSPGSNPSLLPF